MKATIDNMQLEGSVEEILAFMNASKQTVTQAEESAIKPLPTLFDTEETAPVPVIICGRRGAQLKVTDANGNERMFPNAKVLAKELALSYGVICKETYSGKPFKVGTLTIERVNSERDPKASAQNNQENIINQ